MAREIRLKLLQLVLNNPEIKRDAIRAHKEFEDEDDRTLANLLYNCKKDEQIIADEGLHYTIAAKGRAYLKDAGVELPSAGGPKNVPRGRADPVILPSEASGATGIMANKLLDGAGWAARPLWPLKANAATRGIADKLLHQAQDALDEYIASVCDPEILGRFQAARDSARDLVNSLNGAGNGEGGKDHG
jgi:hypothetical protein